MVQWLNHVIGGSSCRFKQVTSEQARLQFAMRVSANLGEAIEVLQGQFERTDAASGKLFKLRYELDEVERVEPTRRKKRFIVVEPLGVQTVVFDEPVSQIRNQGLIAPSG